MSNRLTFSRIRFEMTAAQERAALDALGKLPDFPAAAKAQNLGPLFAEAGFEVERREKAISGLSAAAALSFDKATLLIEALGPYVKEGSFVLLRAGADSYGWVFNGEECQAAEDLDRDDLIDVIGKKGFALFNSDEDADDDEDEDDEEDEDEDDEKEEESDD